VRARGLTFTHDELAQAVGNAVGIYRRGVGLSKRRLAFKLGVDPSYVGLVESGRRLPSLEMLYRLAHELGCPDTWSLLP
jgi:transcriptional regulator with XRE-family HTH domain